MIKQLAVIIIVAVVVCMTGQVCSAVNVALNKITSADSQHNSTYVPNYAVDNDLTTRWVSDNTTPHWWKVDLDGVYNVTSIQVVATATVEDRLDGATLVVYEKSDGTGDATYSNTISVSAAQLTNTFSMPDGITATSIKLSGGDSSTHHMGFRELRVYGTPLTNAALSKAAYSDSYYQNNSIYLPSKAVDGSTGTRWVSKTTTPSWWRVDLGEMYDIDMVEIRGYPTIVDRTDGADLTIYHSFDAVGDSTYSNVVSLTEDNVSPYTSKQLTHNFIMPDGTTARSVKLSGDGNAGGILECAEVRVYGTPRINLATGKVTTVDSHYSASLYNKDDAVDNNLGTRWISSTADVPHWWRVDLGSLYVIEIVQVRVHYSTVDRLNGSDLTLYSTSDTSGGWAYSNTVSVSAAEPVHTFVLPSGVTARSVKLSGVGDASSHVLEIAELRVYGRIPPAGTMIIIQ